MLLRYILTRFYDDSSRAWIFISLTLAFLGWLLDSLLLVVIRFFSDLRNMGTFSWNFLCFHPDLFWRLLNHVPKPRRLSSVPPGVPWRVCRTF